MSFTGFTWAFLGFTEFYWAVLGFTVLFPGLALASCRLGAYYRVSYLVFICFFVVVVLSGDDLLSFSFSI